MSTNPLYPATKNEMLAAVHKGMSVYDLANKKVGKVRLVQFGDESDVDPIPKPEGFYKLPLESQGVLAREGFVLIESGWFSPERYVAARQIAEVVDDSVILNITGKQLITK